MESSNRDEVSYFEYHSSSIILSAFEENKARRRFRKIVLNAKTSEDQFKLVFGNPQLVKELEKLKDDLIFATKKSTKTAIEKLIAGHAAYDAKEYEEALNFYTESILFLPPPSEQSDELWAQCFLHRALTYFRLQLYEYSIADFDESINRTSDDRQKVFLICFKAYALKLAKVSGENDFQVNLSSKNKRMACTTAELDVIIHPNKGRTIKTNEELKTGKLLVVEPAVVAWLRPSFYETYCNHCLRQLKRRCFPCRSCSDVRYCSWSCSELAWKKYHSVECKFCPILKYLVFGTLGLRLMITYGVDNVIKYFQNEKQVDWNVAKLDDSLETVMSLVSDMSSDDDCKFDFEIIIGVAQMTKLAEWMGLIKESTPYLRFAVALKKCVMKVLLNCFYAYDEDIKQDADYVIAEDEYKDIGFCVYSSASMFSHSCNCNANRCFVGSTIHVFANKHIEAGSEVTVDYGTDIFHNSYQYRQSFLLSSFGFECGCEACIKVTDNIHFALRCPKCKGPVIMNYITREDDSNRCLSCGETNIKMHSMEEKVETGDKNFRKAERRIKREEWLRAKSYLKKCIASYEEVYYSKVPIRDAYSLLSLCYENESRYTRAFDSCLDAVKTTETVFGKQSFEYVDQLLNLIQIAIKRNDENRQIMKREDLTDVKTCFEEAMGLIASLRNREFMLTNKRFLRFYPELPNIAKRLNCVYNQ